MKNPELLTKRFEKNIAGVLSCFDRLRIPTWAPFRLQFYFNGHDWLQRRMAAEAITYRKADNCFMHVSDFQRA
jgi:hypothetical protein